MNPYRTDAEHREASKARYWANPEHCRQIKRQSRERVAWREELRYRLILALHFWDLRV